jgi:hypothetical protein
MGDVIRLKGGRVFIKKTICCPFIWIFKFQSLFKDDEKVRGVIFLILKVGGMMS